MQVATPQDALYFTDNSWSVKWRHRIEEWPGVVITANGPASKRKGIRKIDAQLLTEHMQVTPDASMASSGHIAACMAALGGATKICLIGFDCRAVGGATHGHCDYPASGEFIFGNRYLPAWRVLAGAFERMGVDVVNCTPGSAIAAFRFGDLVEEMA